MVSGSVLVAAVVVALRAHAETRRHKQASSRETEERKRETGNYSH